MQIGSIRAGREIGRLHYHCVALEPTTGFEPFEFPVSFFLGTMATSSPDTSALTESQISLDERRNRSKTALRWAALFLGELRDGLTMINMQSAFLIVSKGYSEKQVGILFFVFGMSQFLFQVGSIHVESSHR